MQDYIGIGGSNPPGGFRRMVLQGLVVFLAE